MQLTGKCKKDFEEWLTGNPYDGYEQIEDCDVIRDFYNLPNSFKWCVLVGFFDDNNISIFNFFDHFYRSCPGDYSMDDSRKAAIEKANEIYNQKQRES